MKPYAAPKFLRTALRRNLRSESGFWSNRTRVRSCVRQEVKTAYLFNNHRHNYEVVRCVRHCVQTPS
jgi:hypothetical protein